MNVEVRVRVKVEVRVSVSVRQRDIAQSCNLMVSHVRSMPAEMSARHHDTYASVAASLRLHGHAATWLTQTMPARGMNFPRGFALFHRTTNFRTHSKAARQARKAGRSWSDSKRSEIDASWCTSAFALAQVVSCVKESWRCTSTLIQNNIL